MNQLSDYIRDFRRTEPFAVGQPIFLNSAGSSLPDPSVRDVVQEQLRIEFTKGGYAAANEAEPDIERFYNSAAALIGGSAEGIAYVDSGTRAWNSIMYAVPGLGPGKQIITARSEFGSNLVSLAHLASLTGASVDLVEVDANGRIQLEHLLSMVSERTALVALSMVNAHAGTVNDLAGVGQALKEIAPDVTFVVDGCQAAGQIPIDVTALGASALTVTGRKWLRGPRGSGFLYVDPQELHRFRPTAFDQTIAGLQTPGTFPHTDLSIRDDARRFEMWERSHATMLGLGQAIDVTMALGVDAIQERIAALASALRIGIASIPGLDVLESADERSGIVGVSRSSGSVWEIVSALKETGFEVGAMPRWEAPPAFGGRTDKSVLRLSPHIFNTSEEIQQALDALWQVGAQ